MHLQGSCHCKAVTFTVQSAQPVPYQLCYCDICRKTAGSGGHAINLGADFATLVVQGQDNIRVYRARLTDPDTGEISHSPGERSFCGLCGSALWLWDPRWPNLFHPQAGAIDTPLPVAPTRTHLMLQDIPDWVRPVVGPNDQQFPLYPLESLAAWHDRQGLTD
jgi:hypothetical protein